MATNTIYHQQKVDSVELEADEILELIDQDTGKKGETNIEHYIRYNDKLETIPEKSDEDLPVTAQGDDGEIDFPAIWAVLSILLDTQSNTLQYVKSLQQAVNNYYDKHPTDFMSRLEH